MDDTTRPYIKFWWEGFNESAPDHQTVECDPFQMMLVAHDMISKPSWFAHIDDVAKPWEVTITFAGKDSMFYEITAINTTFEQIIAAGYFYRLLAESYMIDFLMKIKEGQDRIEAVAKRKIIQLPPGVNPN